MAPTAVFKITLPTLSSVTSPMIAAFSEFSQALRALRTLSASDAGTKNTSLPSHARYKGSRPSIAHTPRTPGSTGIFSLSREIPTLL